MMISYLSGSIWLCIWASKIPRIWPQYSGHVDDGRIHLLTSNDPSILRSLLSNDFIQNAIERYRTSWFPILTFHPWLFIPGRSPQLRQEGLVPSVYTFSSLINVHVRSGDLSGALKVRKAMRKQGVRPNVGSLVDRKMWEAAPLEDEFDHLW